MSRKLWQPTPQQVHASQMHDFCQRVHSKYGVAADYEAVRQWSIAHRDLFWEEVRRLAHIEFSRPAMSVCSGGGLLGTKWFDGARLNFARHLLRHSDERDAILFENESGESRRISHRELREEVARCAAALKKDGVGVGDRVAGYLPNIPETVIAMLATASLGAIWSSCSPDFGEQAVIDRFGQIEPKVLFTVDGYSYGGKKFSLGTRVGTVLLRLPSVRSIVTIPYVDEEFRRVDDLATISVSRERMDGILGWLGILITTEASFGDTSVEISGREIKINTWRRYVGSQVGKTPGLSFEEVPFNHPLYIMYSSGTTGVPKCIVHGHGGTLIQHAKEHLLHCDLRPDDRLFYFTTCGWMMWNWLVSGLGTGAAIVLFEGSPSHPDIQRLWQMAARLGVTHFGTSPKYLGACQKSDIHPMQEHDLSKLRCVLSTGSPLSAELFEWTYANVKQDLQLSSISGGTDIISCFMLGNPMLPVHAGEIQCRGLGMDVQAWDENGRPVVGRKGELVCCSPFPSQPVGFWNDAEHKKYKSAYFDVYPDVWRHGDYIEITETGGIVVYGRSDATLNPGGVRIGTAEIYRVVEGLPEIVDSVVVGRNTPDLDVEVCLFVVLRPGLKLEVELIKRIRAAIAECTSKRHVPKHIKQVTAIPYTISGKKVELAVQAMLHGEAVKNRDALANPEALDQYREILK